jgi:hypothetical protein
MDVIEIIQEEIPEELYNRKVINLIEHLLKFNGILFPEETATENTKEAA